MAEKFNSIKSTVEKLPSAKTAVESMKKTGVAKQNDDKKRISGYVDKAQYEKYQKINKLRGVNNNAVLNMLISDYVKEYAEYLDEN